MTSYNFLGARVSMTFVVVGGAHLLTRTHLGQCFIFFSNNQCLLTPHCLGYLWNFEVLQTFFGCKWFDGRDDLDSIPSYIM